MADTKLTALTGITAPTVDDLLYLVNDPAGTPGEGKLALTDLLNTLLGFMTPQGRITLTTGVPYLVATVTAATTIYYTPAVGAYCPIYNGTILIPTLFTELSQATTDSTKSPAAVANNSNYDLFVWNDAGTIRCTRGPAWTSDTGRGTGAGTTELEFVKGLLMNKITITNGPAAQRGTYVGSVRSNGSAQIDMIFGGAGGAGGEGTILGIWNKYNQRLVGLSNFDNTNSWTYTIATFRLKNESASAELNKIKFIIGWQEHGIDVINCANRNTSGATDTMVGIGLNSTSALATGAVGSQQAASAGSTLAHVSTYRVMAPLGFNYVAPLERATASGTVTWYGDNGASVLNSIFSMTTMF